jgi:hypothetical protein
MYSDLITRIFSIATPDDFVRCSLDVFRLQAAHCAVYKKYIECLGVCPGQVRSLDDVPFLPAAFFTTHPVVSDDREPQRVFTSSGTTGAAPARHYLPDVGIYEKSLSDGFARFYGPPSGYTILALLPSYLERQGSSLVYMVEALMAQSAQPDNGFYLHNFDALYERLQCLQRAGRRVLLIGVTYALLDFAATHPGCFPELTVMETGGMKGKREELPRSELHRLLCRGLGVPHIHSEYGMTELLSQAYSKGDGVFRTPPWLQIRIRDRLDPLVAAPDGTTGGVNCIDLANIYSCAFIETQDLGRRRPDGGVEIVGRLEQSDLRGCNLMYEE